MLSLSLSLHHRRASCTCAPLILLMVSWASGIHHFLCTETFTHRPWYPSGHTEHIHTGNIYVLSSLSHTHTHTHTDSNHTKSQTYIKDEVSSLPVISAAYSCFSLTPSHQQVSHTCPLQYHRGVSLITHTHTHTHTRTHAHMHTRTHTHTPIQEVGSKCDIIHPFILLRVTSCSFLLAMRRCVQDI